MKTLLRLLPALALVLLSACGGGGSDGGSAGTPPSPPNPTAATVRVKVVDVLGFAKAGAEVEVSGGGVATTGADGTTRLDLAADTEQVLKISLPGHTGQLRTVRVGAGQSAWLEARLMARAAALTLPDAAAGGTLVGRNAARLTLPPNALVDALTGQPVTGAVQVEMTPVNTNSHEIGAFPGSMRGESGSTTGNLATYGPVEYVLTQAGRRLQLAAGQSATIEMPLHATRWPDGRVIAVGEAMAVWSLDEARGVWVQEGEGEVVASRSSTGLALRASVSHFSWWNPDHFADPVTVRVNFSFPDGVTPTECCHLEGSTFLEFDGEGPGGVASVTLPPSGGEVIVNGGVGYLFAAAGQSAQGALFNIVTVNVPLGVTTLNVTIPLLLDEDPPNPVITSPEAGTTTYTNGPLAVTASVSGDTPDTMELRIGSTVMGVMAPNADATEFSLTVDTSGLPEGDHLVTVRALRENRQPVVSAPRNLVVDRTPPQLTLRSPAPGANQVTTLAHVTAGFNEPMDPASLVNADEPGELRFALLFGGPGSGTAVPAVVEQSTDGRSFTLTPVSPLATNTQYAPRLQGLTDRAGNAMSPVTWSFSVPVFALASDDLRTPRGQGGFDGLVGRPEVALDSLGQPLVVWASQGIDLSQRIEARRLIGGVWVPLPALPTTGRVAELSMDLNLAGQPVVAWTQSVPNTFGCTTTFALQLFAAVFNGSAWVPLGEVPLNIAPCSAPFAPRLRVDELGRPVLVSAQGPRGLTMQVQRFASGSWTLLGQVPPRSVGGNAANVLELRLALDGNVPLVAVAENRSGAIDHFVSRLDGSAFVPVGPRVVLGSVDRKTALAVDASGRPVLAVPVAVTSGLLVSRFDGSAWQVLGSSVTSGAADLPSLIFEADGAPSVGWFSTLDGRAFGSRFDPVLGQWNEPFLIKDNVGTMSEWRRRPEGGPVWLALSTDGFRCCLRAMTADTLP